MKNHKQFSEIGLSPEKCRSTNFSFYFRAVQPLKLFDFLCGSTVLHLTWRADLSPEHGPSAG